MICSVRMEIPTEDVADAIFNSQFDENYHTDLAIKLASELIKSKAVKFDLSDIVYPQVNPYKHPKKLVLRAIIDVNQP